MDLTSAPASSPPQAGDGTRRPSDAFWRGLTVLGIAGSLPTIFALGARHSPLCELCVHFRAYYAAAFLVGTILFLFGRKWKRAAIWGLVFAWNAAGIVPLYFAPADHETSTGAAESDSHSHRIKLLSFNLESGNREYAAFIELVRREMPDVVLLIEFDENWRREVDAKLASSPFEYLHRIVIPRPGSFGFALYSRIPLKLEPSRDGILPEGAKVFGSAGLPTIVAQLKAGSRGVTLVGTHPMPPVRSDRARMRNDQLAEITAFVRTLDGPVIVAGDLNTTSWSPFFQDLINGTRLRDSRKGFGIQPTWTGHMPGIRLPIDHVLVTPEIKVVDRKVGDDIGSDHLPVIVTLEIR
jgi:endonuclease/exonuclease/phosphatase (EEP) superfamily protein YafD